MQLFRFNSKKNILLIFVLLCIFTFSGCQPKEPTLAEKIQQSQKELEEARQKEREAKEAEKKLQEAVDTLKYYEKLGVPVK